MEPIFCHFAVQLHATDLIVQPDSPLNITEPVVLFPAVLLTVLIWYLLWILLLRKRGQRRTPLNSSSSGIN